MVADEVVPRNEMRHMKGRLKQLITSDRVMVNEKNQPVREERNCMNGVFLSNENQPLLLDKGDRRYCGIRCDLVQPIDYYRRIGAELRNGGAEALYHFLLNYDIEDFDEHTKPFETDERTELIAAGEAPPLRFWEDWREQQLPLPYCSCRAQDLYIAFRAWCAQTGERFVPNETQFGLALRPFEDKWFLKQRSRFLSEDRETRPTCYVLLEGSGADESTRSTIMQTTATDFRDAAASYLTEQRKAKL
jgi:putative DNA primase/helicase